jgi:hypothetical protein
LLSKSERQIKRVSADTAGRKEWAGELDTLRAELSPKSVEWEVGKPFVVEVPWGGADSGLGRQLRFSQFELLVLLVEYADGTKEYVTAEIPDGRKQRALTIEVP